jgi:hypothetical protein
VSMSEEAERSSRYESSESSLAAAAMLRQPATEAAGSLRGDVLVLHAPLRRGRCACGPRQRVNPHERPCGKERWGRGMAKSGCFAETGWRCTSLQVAEPKRADNAFAAGRTETAPRHNPFISWRSSVQDRPVLYADEGELISSG